MEKKTIPLNIVMTYPVRWSKNEVFRDFIQNFYDSVGYEQWNTLFHHNYQNKTLTMWVDEICFSYEWLLHIGASTKTLNSTQPHAGYFGEGFKIASLCAVRDFHWQTVMSSGSWELQVVRIKDKIDGTDVEMLGYEIYDIVDKNRSMLKLYPINQEEYLIFQNTIMSFYYHGNPLLGEKIWEGSKGAVFLYSGKEYNSSLPYTNDFGRRGAVFCAYQLLGSNPFGLVLCLHSYKQRDRERRTLYTFEVIDIFRSISYYVSPYGAMRILEKMRRYWNSTPKKAIDIHSWSPIIQNLISKISADADVMQAFRAKYPHLLCLMPIYTIRDRNRRNQARAWLSLQPEKYLLVQQGFSRLGYSTLEAVCEENDGFILNDTTTEKEDLCFDVLEKVIGEIYSGFFDLSHGFPERRIIRNNRASYHGMAKVHKIRGNTTNSGGLSFRYTVGEIYLKKTVFSPDHYFDALATYIHEMCHTFGSDASNAFSRGLTIAMEIIFSHYETVKKYEEEWKRICDIKQA